MIRPTEYTEQCKKGLPKSLPGATALPVLNGVGRGLSKALGG